MTFRKLYLVDVDGAVGYQTINQVADNQNDLRTQMFVEHGSVELLDTGRPGGIRYDALGRHNLTDIPRSVAQTALVMLNATTTPSTGMRMLWNGPGCPSVLRWDVGQYLIPVIGLGSYWAVGQVALIGPSVTALTPQFRPFSASAGGATTNGFWVTTYQLTAGDFVPADMPFTFALHGTP